ncbi:MULTISPECIES: membrane protein insertase YidC [Protofrankia]|uniref:Membrane protein insertase YidC n=2 Tax=Candidatus Protofrankia datiscae TaxID=2716812 RepID=F8B069_9ACTN|nr:MULTISPECIES: membrane protein insertase YidC [Protofrankia]AEH07595.1 membrane protein insertase, YidC/Oxa1 family [Candidatus Protofrankia datiscae]
MLDPLYHLAANAIVFFHGGFGPIFGRDSFFAWALSVVLLVICVRIMIFPLFVKQVKAQRTMQLMQPKIKEIRDKYGHDRQQMNAKIMELQKEHGNPLLGCLPILLQIPLFIALFHVFSHLRPVDRPGGVLEWAPRVGLTAQQVQQIAEAKLLGVSLSTSFTSSSNFLEFVQANGTNVKIFAVTLIVLMGATTFLTQRQIMARTGPVDPQQAIVQKVLLYGSPIMLAVFGFQFPIAVLLYWLTTNLWSMGQQFFVIKKMPPPAVQGAGGQVPSTRSAPGAKNASGTKNRTSQPAPARPAPGARPTNKGKNRPGAASPATGSTAASTDRTPGGAGQAETGAGKTANSNKAVRKAPPGTRSPRGGSAQSSQPAQQPAQPKQPTQPARPSKASDAAEAGEAVPQPAQTQNGSAPAGDDAQPRAGKPHATAGVRRHTGGSRPAKRRGKGGRPGGRR